MPKIEHKGRKIDFRRVVGGFAWPADRPGFAVVVGEHAVIYIHPKDLTQINYYILDEYETWDMTELIKKAISFKAKYNASTFYGRHQKAGSDFLFDYNDSAYNKNLPSFHLEECPSVDRSKDRGLIQYHINVLQSLIRNQTLHKKELEGTQLYRYLLEIPQQGLHEVTDKQFPGPASLGYACVALQTLPTDQEIRQQEVECEKILDEIYGV